MYQIYHHAPIKYTAVNFLHEAIAKKAYELWVGIGEPANLWAAVWLAAERELDAVVSSSLPLTREPNAVNAV